MNNEIREILPPVKVLVALTGVTIFLVVWLTGMHGVLPVVGNCPPSSTSPTVQTLEWFLVLGQTGTMLSAFMLGRILGTSQPRGANSSR